MNLSFEQLCFEKGIALHATRRPDDPQEAREGLATYTVTLTHQLHGRDYSLGARAVRVRAGETPTWADTLFAWLNAAEKVNPEKGWTYRAWKREYLRDHPQVPVEEVALLYGQTCQFREELESFLLSDYPRFVEALDPPNGSAEFQELCSNISFQLWKVTTDSLYLSPYDQVRYTVILVRQEKGEQRQAVQRVFSQERRKGKPTVAQVLAHWLDEETDGVFGGASSEAEIASGEYSLATGFDNWYRWLMDQGDAAVMFESYDEDAFRKMYRKEVKSLKKLYTFLGGANYFRLRRALGLYTPAEK